MYVNSQHLPSTQQTHSTWSSPSTLATLPLPTTITSFPSSIPLPLSFILSRPGTLTLLSPHLFFKHTLPRPPHPLDTVLQTCSSFLDTYQPNSPNPNITLPCQSFPLTYHHPFCFSLSGRANCTIRPTCVGHYSRKSWSFGVSTQIKWSLVAGWPTQSTAIHRWAEEKGRNKGK